MLPELVFRTICLLTGTWHCGLFSLDTSNRIPEHEWALRLHRHLGVGSPKKISHTPRHPTAPSPPVTPSARLLWLVSPCECRCCRHATTLEIAAVATSVLGVALRSACSSSSPAPTCSRCSTPPPPRSQSCSRYSSCIFDAPFIGDDSQETCGPGRRFGSQ
jgi:hypothetical protein